MRYNMLFIFICFFTFLVPYDAVCDSDNPSLWLLGNWACERDKDDQDLFLEFKKDNDFKYVEKIGSDLNIYDLKYYPQIESENDIVIKVGNDKENYKWTIEFKNKKLINIKEKNKIIEICRKIK